MSENGRTEKEKQNRKCDSATQQQQHGDAEFLSIKREAPECRCNNLLLLLVDCRLLSPNDGRAQQNTYNDQCWLCSSAAQLLNCSIHGHWPIVFAVRCCICDCRRFSSSPSLFIYATFAYIEQSKQFAQDNLECRELDHNHALEFVQIFFFQLRFSYILCLCLYSPHPPHISLSNFGSLTVRLNEITFLLCGWAEYFFFVFSSKMNINLCLYCFALFSIDAKHFGVCETFCRRAYK